MWWHHMCDMLPSMLFTLWKLTSLLRFALVHWTAATLKNLDARVQRCRVRP